MKMTGECAGPKCLSKEWKNGDGVIWEVMTWSEEWTGRENPDMVQKVFGICEAKSGTEIDELLQAGAESMAKC